MKYQLYKKDRKEVVPVKEAELNKLAKSKLKEFFEKRIEFVAGFFGVLGSP